MATGRRGIILIILAFSFIAVANSIKCTTSLCAMVIGGPRCPSPPQEIECNEPMMGMPGLPDKCMNLHTTVEQGGMKLNMVLKNCSYAAICANPQIGCSKFNHSGCDVRCCDTDHCNKGDINATQPMGPSGANLTCLECSNVPEVPGVSCRNPVKRTCGVMPGLGAQDRCLTIKGSRRRNGTLEPFELRNCSHQLMCGMNQWCQQANSSISPPGMITSCDAKCCIGKDCNDPALVPSSTPNPGGVTTGVPVGITTGPLGPTASANRFETGLVAICSMVILAFVGIAC